MRYDLEITFEESAKGVETSIRDSAPRNVRDLHAARAPRRQQPDDVSAVPGTRAAALSAGILHRCAHVLALPGYRAASSPSPASTCKGEGRTTKERTLTVKIPAGIADGQRLRISGEGEGGPQNGPPGDLYVFIEVAPHPFFRREGNNLACEIPLNFTTLALGGNIDVPTLDGHDSFKVPEGHAVGHGLPPSRQGDAGRVGRGRGDLFFTVQAVTPKKLNKEQRAAARAVGQGAAEGKIRAAPRDAEEDEKNIFEKVKDIFG